MSLKDKMLARRNALIQDRADALLSIERCQQQIASLERLRQTQHGAIQDCEHWLKEIEEEEARPTDIDRLLDESHETRVKLDEAISAAETDGMCGGLQLVAERAS